MIKALRILGKEVARLSWISLLVMPMIASLAWAISDEDSQSAGPPDEGQTLDAESAWAKLQGSHRQRLRSASDSVEKDCQKRIRRIMDELTGFAEDYRGTRQATMALYAHANLATQISDYEAADKSIATALKLTKDPRLVSALRAMQSRMAIRPGRTPPAFTAKALDGREISPADYRGKVLLLDFWAVWCGPCIAELPHLKRVYAQYHEKGLEVVSISLDRRKQTVRSFVKKRKMNWTHIHNASQSMSKDIAIRYNVNVTGIPAMILIGRDGKVITSGTALRGPGLAAAVAQAVKVKTRDNGKSSDAEHASPETGQSTHPVHTALGHTAPPMAVQEWLQGKPTTLAALRGKVVLLDIFQIICPGCHRAYPQITRIQKEYRESGLEVVGLCRRLRVPRRPDTGAYPPLRREKEIPVPGGDRSGPDLDLPALRSPRHTLHGPCRPRRSHTLSRFLPRRPCRIHDPKTVGRRSPESGKWVTGNVAGGEAACHHAG